MELTEQLPADGATFRCSFEFTGYVPSHRCKKVASQGLAQAAYDSIIKNLPHTITLHGRAVCGLHAETVSGYARH